MQGTKLNLNVAYFVMAGWPAARSAVAPGGPGKSQLLFPFLAVQPPFAEPHNADGAAEKSVW